MKNCLVCKGFCSEEEGSVCLNCSPVQKCVDCDQSFRSLYFDDNRCLACATYNDEIEDDIDPDCDESMDGDFDSAMASAGFGTDEDYGYYGSND